MGDSIAQAFPLLESPDRCPVCGPDTQLRPLHVDQNRKRMMAARSLAWIGCERCGLLFTHPRPTQEELDSFYAGTDGWRARKEWDLDADYSASEKNRHHALAHELLASYLTDPPGRALDFGCGRGAWLDVLQDAGWETWGVEPGAARQVAARRHRMVDAIPSGQRFDFVVVNHVLEHLAEPLDVLKQITAATRPGGQLYVSVPDLTRLGEHGHLGYVVNGVHICSYTAAALSAILGLAGFRVVAHFDTLEWDSVAAPERCRLKLLAQSVGKSTVPTGDPLQEAIASLVEYARGIDQFDEKRRQNKRTKKSRKKAAASSASG